MSVTGKLKKNNTQTKTTNTNICLKFLKAILTQYYKHYDPKKFSAIESFQESVTLNKVFSSLLVCRNVFVESLRLCSGGTESLQNSLSSILLPLVKVVFVASDEN